jgi:hypothetical protein
MDNNKGLQIDLGINVQPLQQGLQQASQAVTQFGTQLNSIKRPAADATQSLVNLSRIAQDAPYGFIGIANNLNPMLESFERLQKETGSASGALKAMVSGLMGPAGLGVALGVVSSLFLAFGGRISDFVNALLSGNDALKSEKEALAGIGTEFTSVLQKVEKVGIAFQEYHSRIITGNEALKVYNEELGKNFGIKSNINEAEQTFKDKTAAYVEASLQRALADSASKKAAEELLKQKLESLKAPEEYRSFFDLGSAGTGGGAGVGVNTADQAKKAQLARQKENLDEQQKIIEQYRKIAFDAQSVSDLYAKGFNFDLKPDKVSKSGDTFAEYMAQQKYELQKELNDLINLKKKFEALDLSPILDVFNPKADKEEEKRKQYFDKQLKELTDQSKKSGLGDFLQRDSAERVKQWDIEEKKVKGLNDSYKSFAKTLSQDVTNSLMGMYTSMQNGKSFGQAFLDMLGQMVEQLGALIIKTLIFDAIMAVLTGGTSAAGAVAGVAASDVAGSAGKMLMVPKYAEGGITTKAHIGMIGEAGPEAIMPLSKLGAMMKSTFNAGAMSGTESGSGGQFVLKGNDLVLALNRSNYSLNLRRGA